MVKANTENGAITQWDSLLFYPTIGSTICSFAESHKTQIDHEEYCIPSAL